MAYITKNYIALIYYAKKVHLLFFLFFYFFFSLHCVNASAGGLLVLKGITSPVIRVSALTWIMCITSPVVSVSVLRWIICITSPVVSVSAKTWIIWYIYYRSLLYINNVIITTTKVLLPQVFVTLVDFGDPVLAF